jgi:hypothetical protein
MMDRLDLLRQLTKKKAAHLVNRSLPLLSSNVDQNEKVVG